MADESRDLLRIAMAMNGGVSLAVWMGGVAAETLELVRSASCPPGGARNKYAALTELLRYEPQVDIISGTSAGGLNGVLLAYALSNGIPTLDGLRRIWLKHGDFAGLLRDADEPDPASLLQGDAVFLRAIEKGLEDLVAPRVPLTDPVDWPVSLFVTSTLLDGESREFPDDFDERIVDTDHQLLFTFRYDPGGDNDFDRTDEPARKRLAKAARSSASFPGAFEPTLVEVGDDAGLDMSTVIAEADRISGNAWMVDGGVLMNRPIAPAINAIFNQVTERSVRRVLAYVHPDPATARLRPPADPQSPPSLSSVIAKSVVTIPRQESISTEIGRLRDHNRSVRSQRASRDALVLRFPPGDDIIATARSLVPAYRMVRSTRSVSRTVDTVYQTAAKLTSTGDDAWLPPTEDLRRVLLCARLKFLPAQDRFFRSERSGDAMSDDTSWRYGISTAQRIVGTVIDLVHRFGEALALATSAGVSPADTFAEERQAIERLLGKATSLLALIEEVRQTDKGQWSAATLRLRRLLSHGGTGEAAGQRQRHILEEWAEDSYANWTSRWKEGRPQSSETGDPLAEVGTAALDAASILLEEGQIVDSVERKLETAFPDPSDIDECEGHLWQVAVVVRQLTREADADEVLQRLLALEVIQLVGGQESGLPQEVELIQISALADQHLIEGGPTDPAEKLTGVELGHFGAFLKGSWRANDWMWGRLDAVSRMVSVLIEPRRLRQLYGTDAAALYENLAVVATASDDPELAAWLAGRWEAQGTAVREELAAMLTGSTVRLDLTRAAIVRALQLEVIRHELPNVYQALLSDEQAKSHVADSRMFRARFVDAVTSPDQSPCFVKPGRAESFVEGAFGAFQVGRETIGDEISSDRGVQTAVHAAVVGTSAAGGQKPLRSIAPPVRGALLWVHRLYRYFTPDTGLARVLRFLTFAVAGALIATSFISREANPLTSVIGLVVLLMAFLLGLPKPAVLLWSVGFVAAAFLVWNAGTLKDLNWVGVAVACSLAGFLGTAVFRWKWAAVGPMVLVALTLFAVATIEPLGDWLSGDDADVAEPVGLSAEAEELKAKLEDALDGGRVEIIYPEDTEEVTGVDAALEWIERHRIEVTAFLLIVGFSGIGAYRARRE